MCPILAGAGDKAERPGFAARVARGTGVAANASAAQALTIVFDAIAKFIGLIGKTGDAFGRLSPHVAVVTCTFLLGAFALVGAFILFHRQQSLNIDSQALELELRINESRALHDVRPARSNCQLTPDRS
jgi:hypothetical protein